MASSRYYRDRLRLRRVDDAGVVCHTVMQTDSQLPQPQERERLLRRAIFSRDMIAQNVRLARHYRHNWRSSVCLKNTRL